MKITLDISYSTIDFEGDKTLQELVEEALHVGIGVREPGYQFSKAYKIGAWDGIQDYYNKEDQTFPTGLADDVDKILGTIQSHYDFEYTFIDDRPDPLLTIDEVPDEIQLGDITLRDYQQESVEEAVKNQYGVWHLATNAGKSKTAVALIKIALPKLLKGENATIFTHSKEIFRQLYEELDNTFDEPIGKIQSGKIKPERINVAMIPTVASALKIDPEAKISLSSKQMVIKKVAKNITPKFTKGVNNKHMLKAYIKNFPVKTKADQHFIDELEEILSKSESDAKLRFHLNGYTVKYMDIIKEKNEKNYKKKKEMVDFLDSVVVGLYDEFHRAKGEGYYNTVMGCRNALIKVGMTGSIDEEDPILMQNLKATTHRKLTRASNKDMIDRGISAKPKISLIPINQVIVEGEKVDLITTKDYHKSYDYGIVKNEYRNMIGAKITEMYYKQGKGILIIVNRIEHGELMSELLDQFNVEHEFLRGELPDEERQQGITDMKSGKLKVIIATTILDEGVDISGIDVLVHLAGGKSLRQVLQRVGRSLRKKEGDNRTDIFDFLDNTNTHLHKHGNQRKDIYINEKFDVDILDG